MATLEGFDYSWDRPNLGDMYRAGRRFAVRYTSYDRNGKNITRTEARANDLAGIYNVTSWENLPADALQGFNLGHTHAQVAGPMAAAAGQAPDRPIYFAVDFDAQPHQMAAIGRYLDGAASYLGGNRIGVYGGWATIDYMWKFRHAQWFWQTYAWSAGRIHVQAHIYQYSNHHNFGGADVDYDRSYKSDFGQWTAGAIPVVPPTLPGAGTDIATPWDYSGTVSGTGDDIGNLGGILTGQARALQGLRG